MGTSYSQLTAAKRLVIESMRLQGRNQKSIALAIGVSAATVSRELSRNWASLDGYVASEAHGATAARRALGCARARKLGPDVRTALWRTVIAGLRCRWSPEQIAGRLALMPSTSEPDEPPARVSHETIYCAIYAMPRGALRSELIALLRQSHKTRMPRARGTPRFTGMQGMTPICLRPPEVAARIVPGHWEGDLIKGAMNRSSVATLVERTSRYVILAKLENSSARCVLDAFTRRMKTVPESLRKTLTYDQGTEMASHALLAKQLKIDVFFCDPHSPWQRGTNENTNGLLREYLPKGIDLRQFTHQDLTAIEHSLNGRPRKILGFRTPAEVFSELKLNQVAGVALQT
jgi:transposase, IS30 family